MSCLSLSKRTVIGKFIGIYLHLPWHLINPLRIKAMMKVIILVAPGDPTALQIQEIAKPSP